MKLAILQGATLSLVIRVAAAGLILGQSVLLARLMTPEDFGLFNYLVVTTGLLALILQWGMDKSAIRFLPAYVADGNIGAIRTFTAWSFRRMVKLAPVAALAAIALTIAATGTGVTPVVWLCAALVCLALAAVQFLQQIERGFKRIGRSQVFEQIVMPALVLCWAAGFWLLRDAVSVGAIMVGYFASMLLCFLMLGRSVSSNLSRRRRESGSRVASENDDESRWRSVGFSLAIGGLMSYLLIRGEILIVGWFLEGADIARYSVSLRIANLAIFGLSAVTAIGGPVFSELYHRRAIPDLQSAVSFAALASAVLSLPVLVIGLAVPEFVLGFFGQSYVASSDLLRVLTVAAFLKAIVGPVAVLLMVTGQERFYVRTLVAITLAKFAALVPAAMVAGVQGVAIVSGSMTVAWTIALSIGVITRVGVLPLPVNRPKPSRV